MICGRLGRPSGVGIRTVVGDGTAAWKPSFPSNGPCWIRADTTRSNRPLNCGNCHVIHDNTIFEGTSEIQRMLIGRTVTGLDVR